MPDNSQIRAKGVGKDAVRHDLDGTPGLSSDLQYGEVGQLEAGQRSVQNSRRGQTSGGGGARALPGDAPIQVPDPVSFAIEKIGGQSDLPTQRLQQFDTSEFMPLLNRLASGNSSSILKEAYMQMVANIAQRPWGGAQTVVIDRQELDRNVEQAF